MTTLPNILHSDNSRENLTVSEWNKLKKNVGATENDTIVLVWGDDRDFVTGGKEIIIRAKEATIGIPSETRQAFRDGTNGFERILPGPERMYPDTDLPPVKISPERRLAIIKDMPTPFWETENWYKEIGLDEKYFDNITLSNKAPLFKKIIDELDIDPNLVARVINDYPHKILKSGLDTSYITDHIIFTLLESYKKGKIVREGIFFTLESVCANEGFSNILMPEKATLKEIDATIEKSKKVVNDVSIRKPDKYSQILMGVVMDKLRGRVCGEEVFKTIEAGLEA